MQFLVSSELEADAILFELIGIIGCFKAAVNVNKWKITQSFSHIFAAEAAKHRFQQTTGNCEHSVLRSTSL